MGNLRSHHQPVGRAVRGTGRQPGNGRSRSNSGYALLFNGFLLNAIDAWIELEHDPASHVVGLVVREDGRRLRAERLGDRWSTDGKSGVVRGEPVAHNAWRWSVKNKIYEFRPMAQVL